LSHALKGAVSRARLQAWVTETLPHALAYATSLLRDRDAAEDAVHDCYCRILQRADTYDLPRDGMKILIRSVTNACIDRAGRRRVLASLDEARPAADPRAKEPAAAGMARELEEAVDEALSRLPLAQRAALEMKSLGHSLEEVAQALGISANHAGVLVHRARQDMARRLGPLLKGDTA
jgi:RNA polymerase sigma-70 factor (ECF subfamily)